MPSPFPGMDPFIESQGLWADCRAPLIHRCRAATVSSIGTECDCKFERVPLLKFCSYLVGGALATLSLKQV